MKKLLLLFTFLFYLAVFAQNYTIDQPELRINRTTGLTLTTAWQTVDFNGTTGDIKNTYGKDPVSGNNTIWYDSATKKIMVIGDYDKHFGLQLFFATVVTGITLKSKLRYRIVVPNGTSPGVDAYFPAPELGGYADVGEITVDLLQTNHPVITLNATARQAIRTNGFYIQVCMTSNLLNGVVAATGTLTGIVLNLKSSN